MVKKNTISDFLQYLAVLLFYLVFSIFFAKLLKFSSPLATVFLTIGILAFVLALTNFKLFFFTFLMVYPLTTTISVDVFGQNIGLTGVLYLSLTFLTIVSLITRVVKNKQVSFPCSYRAIIIFLFLVFLGAVTGYFPKTSLRGSMRYLSFAAIIFLIPNIIKTNKDRVRLVQVIIISSLPLISYGLWQKIFKPEALNYRNVASLEMGRIRGFYGSAVFFGLYLSLFIGAFALSFIFHSNSLRGRIKYGLLYIVSTVVSLFSVSRNAWLTLISSVIVILSLKKMYKILTVFIGASLIIFFSVEALNKPFLNFSFSRVLEGRRVSTLEGRFIIWLKSLPLLKRSIFTGLGPGSFPVYYENSFNRFIGTHSTYLMLWSETGLFALLAYLYILYTSIKQAIKSYFNSSKIQQRAILGGVVASLVGISIAGLVDNVFHITLFVLTGSVLGLAQSKNTDETSKTKS